MLKHMEYAATAVGILPTGADATLITDFTGQVGADIGIVLAVLGFGWAVKFVLKRFNHARNGRL